jgi:hypothetical protein
MSDVDDVPAFENDWEPLRRALIDALWVARLALPRSVVIEFTAAVVDALEAAGVVLVEVDPR